MFVEGWALYGENPLLSDDVDLYKDNLLQKYGMFKWQVTMNLIFINTFYLSSLLLRVLLPLLVLAKFFTSEYGMDKL